LDSTSSEASLPATSLLRRLTIGLLTAGFVMTLLNAMSFFVLSSGDPRLDGTHAFGCPLLIWQTGGISSATQLRLDALLLAIACTAAWGIALGLFAGHDLERLAKWLRLSTPKRRPLTLKTLLGLQLAVGLVVGAALTGIAGRLVEPLILLGPIGGWLFGRVRVARDVPYAAAIFLIAAFATIASGAASSTDGSVVEAVAYCIVSWIGQAVIYWGVKRSRARNFELS
jgi:hypothetical protein